MTFVLSFTNSASILDVPLYCCKVGKKFIGTTSHLMTDFLLELAVIKLQKKCPRDLPDVEKDAVACLCIEEKLDAQTVSGDGPDTVLFMCEPNAKQRRMKAPLKRYVLRALYLPP